jgi:hypothetical protein
LGGVIVRSLRALASVMSDVRSSGARNTIGLLPTRISSPWRRGLRPLSGAWFETDVPLDSSTTAHYTFAAPPPDVTEIDVSVGDWPTFRDIPITR